MIKYFRFNPVKSVRNKRIRRNLLNAVPFWLGAFVTGVVAVSFAKIFMLAENGTAFIFHYNKYLFFAITPFCFLLAAGIVAKFAPYARGSGIPQLTAAVELSTPGDSHKTGRLLSIRIIIVKICSTILIAFGGGAIGREGPTIQIAGSIFKKINDWLPSWYPKLSKKNMLITGAAAGLAAAFNTPLGGIVFAIEELTKSHISYFKSALLTGVIIAGVTALNIIGPYLYLGYPDVSGINFHVLVPILIVAPATGVAGSMMGKLILYLFRLKKKFTAKFGGWSYTIVCGLLVAALAVFIDGHAFGSGKEIMETTLFSANKKLEWYVPVLRFFAPIISFSSGAAGGIFAPALSAGAGMGAVIAGWLQLSATNTNLVILCGMAGFLTGITRSGFTSSILVLEMTDANNIIFYLLMATLIANIAASFIDRHSFYDRLKVQYIQELNRADIEAARALSPDPLPPATYEE